MALADWRRLECRSGWLVLDDPGGDEPRTHGYATRIYTGYHAIRVQPGCYLVGVNVESPLGATVIIQRDGVGELPPFDDSGRAFNVASGRFVIADAQAFTPNIESAVMAGDFAAARVEGVVVVEQWPREHSRLTWDKAPPDSLCLGIVPTGSG